MVRKSLIWVVTLALCAFLAMPISASAAEPYEDGNISTTMITIFRDVANKIKSTDDYVFFRADQYEYKMVVGDLEYNSAGLFSADEATVYSIISNSGYSSSYMYSVSEITDFELTVGVSLVYSNLGEFPDLIERGFSYEFATLLLLLVGLCCYLLRSVFGFCIRSRN